MLSLITAIFGAIPVVGTIVSSFFNMKTQMAQISATENVSEAQISAQIITATMSDVFIRVCRDILIFFPVVWAALIGWDTIMAVPHPDLMWHVAPYPGALEYLPYAVMVFLLGNIGLNMWNRK